MCYGNGLRAVADWNKRIHPARVWLLGPAATTRPTGEQRRRPDRDDAVIVGIQNLLEQKHVSKEQLACRLRIDAGEQRQILVA